MKAATTTARVGDVEPPVVSLVIPVFNEEDTIGPFLESLNTVEQDCRRRFDAALVFEYVFVNDGSRDSTLAALIDAHTANPSIHVLDLSRNFGKEAALTAGIDYAHGHAVIPIDVDLQDPPTLILPMLEAWREGSEVVVARRISRHGESWLKRMTAYMFYRLHNVISRTTIPQNVGDFRLMDRVVVDALKSLPENHRFMKGLFAWVGFHTVTVDYDQAPRSGGRSKFSGFALWRLAVEGFTSFSTAPLVIWTYIGLSVAFGSFVMALFIFAQKLFFGIEIPGYAALSVAVFFLGGVQLMGIGILGEYVGRTYLEAKQRPTYLIRKRYGNAS